MSRCIDINIGAKCSASCEHCCFSCTPQSSMEITDEEIDNILDYVEKNKEIERVSVTGGEPLLRYETVKRIVRRCHDAGKMVSVVSNGFWGATLENAIRIAKELKESGLDIMTISYDEFHKKFVPSKSVSNVLQALKSFNIKASLNISVDKRHQSVNVLEDLGESVFGVGMAIMPVCRAGQSKSIEDTYLYTHKSDMVSRRCPSQEWEMVIHHDGYVYPCCSPMVFETELRVGNIRKQSLDQISHNLKANGLLYILKKEGLEWFANKLEIKIDDERYVNTCEICKKIFGDSSNISRLEQHVKEYYEN